jgi:hypothetical protein
MALVPHVPLASHRNTPLFHFIAQFLGNEQHLRWCMRHLQHEPTQHAWLLHIRAALLLQQSYYEQHGVFMSAHMLERYLTSMHAHPQHRRTLLFLQTDAPIPIAVPSQDLFVRLWDAAVNDTERQALWSTLHIYLRMHPQNMDPRLRVHLANHHADVPNRSHPENV